MKQPLVVTTKPTSEMNTALAVISRFLNYYAVFPQTLSKQTLFKMGSRRDHTGCAL